MGAFTVNPMGPAGPWPQPAIDARQGMIDFYGKLLEAAKKVFPDTQIAVDLLEVDVPLS